MKCEGKHEEGSQGMWGEIRGEEVSTIGEMRENRGKISEMIKNRKV